MLLVCVQSLQPLLTSPVSVVLDTVKMPFPPPPHLGWRLSSVVIVVEGHLSVGIRLTCFRRHQVRPILPCNTPHSPQL